jgi:hypothetical protein
MRDDEARPEVKPAMVEIVADHGDRVEAVLMHDDGVIPFQVGGVACEQIRARWGRAEAPDA